MRRANAKATHDLDQGGVARYHQLSSLFRRRIESGDWPVGRQIPTLGALAAEFQVAPATVRRAVDSLVQEGVLACYREFGIILDDGPKRVVAEWMVPVRNRGDWRCDWVIHWPHRSAARRYAVGVDSTQAMLLAMESVEAELALSDPPVFWHEPGDKLELPAIKGSELPPSD